jgi:hypothetical protein
VNPPDSAPETARFATASAIVTGISLLLGGVAGVLLIAMALHEPPPQQAPFHGMMVAAPAALSLVVVGAPALLGILLGAKALAEVRRSGGQKAGFGFAMFGMLAWPVLIPIAVTGLLIVFFLSAGLKEGPSSGETVEPAPTIRAEPKPIDESANTKGAESQSPESGPLSGPQAMGLERNSMAAGGSRESSPVDSADRHTNERLNCGPAVTGIA